MGKGNKIRHIVRICQVLRTWRMKARPPSSSHRSPPDVPAGHVAICVGSNCRRFVVRATHLNHPIFKWLLSKVEEEYGFSKVPGPLAIPCDESLFEEILGHVSRDDSASSNFQRRCHIGIRIEMPDYLGESRPMLYGFAA